MAFLFGKNMCSWNITVGINKRYFVTKIVLTYLLDQIPIILPSDVCSRKLPKAWWVIDCLFLFLSSFLFLQNPIRPMPTLLNHLLRPWNFRNSLFRSDSENNRGIISRSSFPSRASTRTLKSLNQISILYSIDLKSKLNIWWIDACM